MDMGVDGNLGATGGGQLGCLESHVASLLGANTADRRVLQAFPNMPAFANETAGSITLCGPDFSRLELLWFVRMAFPSARFHMQGAKFISCP